MRKGSKEAKAWGRKMKRLRTQKTTKRKKTKRKTTTRKRRTTRARKGEKTLSGRQAYPKTVKRRAVKRISKSGWNW